MKFNSDKISINYVLNQNGIVKFFLHSVMLLFFKSIRVINKLLSGEGQGVLVISLHRLGDTVFTIPAIKELKKKYPDNLSLVCYPESVPIYKLEFKDLNIYPINKGDFYFGERIAKSEIKQRLQSTHPALIVDITGSMKSASLIFNIRAKRIIGTNGNQFKTIYDSFAEFREKPKLTDIYLDVVQLEVELSESKEFIRSDEKLNKTGKVLIHPFAGWKEKEWNIKKFISLAELLNKIIPVSFIIQKQQLSRDVISEIENSKIDVIQTESVDELILNIREASLFIGNDSGPVNVANYFNKPTLTIFGATNSDYSATGLQHQKIIQERLKCSADTNEKFCAIGGMFYKCSGVQCMNHLSLDKVYASVTKLLN